MHMGIMTVFRMEFTQVTNQEMSELAIGDDQNFFFFWTSKMQFFPGRLLDS